MEGAQELEAIGMAKKSDLALSDLGHSTFANRDEQHLARLGKAQVLKVCEMSRGHCSSRATYHH